MTTPVRDPQSGRIGVAIVEDKRFISQAGFSRSTINPMFQCILGRSTENLVKVSWTEITHPDDLQEDLRQFQRFRSGKINGYSMEKRFVRPDGTAVWVSMSISPLIGIHDDPSLHLCLILIPYFNASSHRSFCLGAVSPVA